MYVEPRIGEQFVTYTDRARHPEGTPFENMALARFIRDLYREECEFKLGPEITHQLEAAVTSVVKDLIPNCFHLFPGSRGRLSVQEVSNAGSYFEQTKIIAPDEYDFMLVIRELSGPEAVEICKGCRDGYVKIKTRDQDRWGRTSADQTPERSFLIAVLEFNSYVRQAVELFNQGLKPYGSEDGKLVFKRVLSRGKPYKQFSFVQTAYFEWKYRYNAAQSQNYHEHDESLRASASYTNHTHRRCNLSAVGSSEDDKFDMELLYSRTRHESSSEEHGIAAEQTFNEILDLDVDLMACCHVQIEMLADVLPKESLENPYLIKNGCHIVLKPCGNPRCILEDTDCRLISYTKSEQELMRNLHPNWKMVYKFMKWVFHKTDSLGVDSYKLKTGVLHLSQNSITPEAEATVDNCMRSLLSFLLSSSVKNHMPSFFNPTLNVWNISPRFKYYVKWDMELIYRLLIGIVDDPSSEYNYSKFHRLLCVRVEQSCDVNIMTALHDLERETNPSPFRMFCVQGNAFLDVVRGMERELADCAQFRRVARWLKWRVCVDLAWEIARWFWVKLFGFVKKLIGSRLWG